MNIKKIMLWAGAGMLFFLAVLTAGLYGYSRSDHARNVVVNQINAAIPGTLSAGQIRLLAEGALLRLDDVQLLDTQGNPCLAFDSLGIEIHWASLFDKILEIRLFRIDGLVLDLTADADGRMNLLQALMARDDMPDNSPEKDSSGNGLPMNVIIRTAQIAGGAVAFSDPDNTVDIKTLDVTVTEVDLQQMSGAVSIEAEQITFSGITTLDVPSLNLSASVKEKNAGTFKLDLTSAAGVLTASGSVKDLLNQPRVDLTAEITADLAAVSRISSDMPDLGGTLHLNLSGRGSVNDPEVQLKISGQDLAMAPDVQDGRLDVAVNLAERLLTLETGRAELPGITTAMSGSADLSRVFPEGFLESAPDFAQMTYALSFEQTGGDFIRLAPWMPGFSGQFSSRGRVEGRGVSLNALSAGYDLTAIFKGFKHNQADIDPLDLTVQVSGDIDKQVLALNQLSVETLPANVKGSGTYDLAGQMLDMDVTVSSGDLEALTRAFGLFPARGRVSAAVQVQGPVNEPEVAAVLEGRDLGAAGMVVDRLDLKATLDRQGKAALTDLTVQGPGVNLAASGTADLFDSGFVLKKQLQMSLTTKGKIRPQTMLAQTDLKVDSRFMDTDTAFDLDVRGTYDRGASVSIADVADITLPRQTMAARVDLTSPRVSLFLENLVDITGALNMNTSEYAVDLDFKAGDAGPLLSAVGLPGISGSVKGWLRSSGTLPEDLTAPLATRLASAKGSVSIEADVAGTALKPDFNAVMNVTDLVWQPEDSPLAVAGMNGRMTLSPDRVIIHELTAQIDQGRVTLNGEAVADFGDGNTPGPGSWEKMKAISATLNLSGENLTFPVADSNSETVWMESLASSVKIHLDVSQKKKVSQGQTLTSAGPADSGFSGRIPAQSIMAVLEINSKDQQGLDLSVTLDKTIGLKASFNPQTSEFDIDTRFSGTSLDPFLEIAGLSGVSGGLDGKVKTRGRINLDLPPQVTDQLKPAKGILQVQAEVGGVFSKPDVNARVLLENLHYPIPEAGLGVSNLNGRLTLSNDRLTISSLTGDLGQGTLDVSGDLGLDNFIPVSGQARVLTRNVAISVEDTLEAAFNTDLMISGSLEKAGVTGKVEMIHGEFYRDFEFDLAEALESRKMGSAGPVEPPPDSKAPSIIDNMTLDITVHYKDPFILDNNLAFIMVEPDLKITGTVRQPVITGRANIAEGTVVYQKRQFDIDTGIIDFVDPFKIEPKITLQANTAIRKWVIYMDVRGRTDNLRFRLYSDPAETHEDILSLLILGKTTRELGQGGSYTGILADKASEMVGREVASSTPLDTFALGYDESGGHGGSVNVTMGKKLSERLEVIYSMKTEDQETVHTNSAEYKMLENVILRAFNDSKGDFGTEITLKLEFR